MLSEIIDSLLQGVVIFDTKIIYANAQAHDILGYVKGELRGKYLSEILHGGSPLVRRCVLDNKCGELEPAKLGFLTSDSQHIQLNAYMKNITYNGKAVCMLVFDSYSGKRTVHESMSESENLFRILTENSFVGIYIYRDKYIYANPEYIEKTGYSMKELLQMSPWEIVHEESREIVRENVTRRLSGEVFSKKYNERKIITKSGEVRTFRVATNTVAINGEYAGIGSTIDITDLKELQDSLEDKVKEETYRRHEQEQLLIQQSKLAEMGAMLRSVAHQWKQPLNAVHMLMQDMMKTYSTGELNEEYISWVYETSTEQLKYMMETMKDFMDYLRPSKKREVFRLEESLWPSLKIFSHQVLSLDLSIELKCFDKAECGTAGTDDMFQHKSCNLILDCENCQKKGVFIDGYKNEFMQVLLNIFNNAKDAIVSAMRKGRVDSGRIDISISSETDKVLISVEDNGGGIPESNLEKIFEPYFTTKTAHEGSGIGLYMAKAIIEKNMSGTMRAENGKNGAVMTIILDKQDPIANLKSPEESCSA
jgi:PAS domain S-box-containing protein